MGSPYTRDCRRIIAAANKRIGDAPAGSARIHPAIPLPDPEWDHGTAIIGSPGSGKTVILAAIADSIVEAGKPLIIIEEGDFFHKRYKENEEISSVLVKKGMSERELEEALQAIAFQLTRIKNRRIGGIIIRVAPDGGKAMLGVLYGFDDVFEVDAHVLIDGASLLGPEAVRKLAKANPTAFTLQAGAAAEGAWSEMLKNDIGLDGTLVFCEGSDSVARKLGASQYGFGGKLGANRGRVAAAANIGRAGGLIGPLEWPFPGTAAPSRGRPKKEESLRDGALTVGLTADERAALEAAAAKDGTTPSALARKAIASYIGR